MKAQFPRHETCRVRIPVGYSIKQIQFSVTVKQCLQIHTLKFGSLPDGCHCTITAAQQVLLCIPEALKEHDTDHRKRHLAGFKTRRGQLQSCLIAINLPLFFTKYHLRPQLHNSFPITQLKWNAWACSLTLKSYAAASDPRSGKFVSFFQVKAIFAFHHNSFFPTMV